MALTTSLAFPNMFNISNNSVSVYEDLQSVTNRTRLLILTSPTELYNSSNFGVGLKNYLWQYNTVNTKAIIEKKIQDQLALHEPCVEADKTVFSDGLRYTEDATTGQSTAIAGNELDLTVAVITTFGSKASVDLNSDSNSTSA